MKAISERVCVVYVCMCICWFSNRTISSVVSIFEIFSAPRNALHAICLQETLSLVLFVCVCVCAKSTWISHADSFRRMGVLALGSLSISEASSTWIMAFFMAFVFVRLKQSEKYLVNVCVRVFDTEWEEFQYATITYNWNVATLPVWLCERCCSSILWNRTNSHLHTYTNKTMSIHMFALAPANWSIRVVLFLANSILFALAFIHRRLHTFARHSLSR